MKMKLRYPFFAVLLGGLIWLTLPNKEATSAAEADHKKSSVILPNPLHPNASSPQSQAPKHSIGRRGSQSNRQNHLV